MLPVGCVPVYLVTYDVSQQKEQIQTKFHRNDETMVTLVKDLVEQFNSTTSTDTLEPTMKQTANKKHESHVMHVQL
jgi:predicted Rossmann fold nucleotide-binding protein DprA/Smf involved in DNA uptake